MTMRIRRLGVALTAVFAVVALLPAAAGAAPANPRGTVVTGLVTDTRGHPLAGVAVRWEVIGNDVTVRPLAATTDADGRFVAVRRTTETDPANVYFDGTNASGPTSEAGYLGGYLLDRDGNRVVVTPQPGQRIAGGVTRLAAATGASGVVTGDDGRPLAHAQVATYDVPSIDDDLADLAITTTDALGRWTLRGLDLAGRTSAPATFHVSAYEATGGTSPTGYAPACLGVVPEPCGEGLGGVDPTYVTLTRGRSTAGVDIALPTAGRLTGRLTDVAGHGIGGAVVYVFGTGLDAGASVPVGGGVETDADGYWTDTFLFPQSYAVCYSRGIEFPVDGQVSAGRPAPYGWQSECAHDSPMTAGFYAGDLYGVTSGSTTTVPTDSLVADGAVAVRAVDTAGHTVPRVTFRVGILDHGTFLTLRQSLVRGGQGTLERVPPGRVLVCASAPGYVTTCPPAAGAPSVQERPYAKTVAPDIVLTPVGG